MSKTQRHIVMIGVQIDEDMFDKYEDIKDSKLDLIYDGMNGEYIVIGKIINDGSYYDGLKFDSISLLNLMEMFGEVECLLRDELDIEQEVRLFSFTHWY